jgi:hypothetical protein
MLSQIIENDVSSSDLCTRREFARWFVKLSSKFERYETTKQKKYLGHLLLFVYLIFVNYRKRMQKIIPSKLIAGCGETAFDDVNSDDPDFLYIQCK